jgi:hypothetical protein
MWQVHAQLGFNKQISFIVDKNLTNSVTKFKYTSLESKNQTNKMSELQTKKTLTHSRVRKRKKTMKIKKNKLSSDLQNG